MMNILSYVGMNMQSEVCLWTLLGLMRTIFDATLFKVNANLKQVWQMSMPGELSMPVQRVLRTMISGIMLVQCFTVYVYLASYIVLLYPVFLEERPTLVLPWLLLAAIRKLLCELTSLAMGLGTCVLLGPARPPCIKFLVVKIATIMPAFYKWILVYSYYNALKVASTYKTFPIVLPPSGLDYGLELAVRRRCTKSLFGEEQLRKKLAAGFYAEQPPSVNINITRPTKLENTTSSSRNASGSEGLIEEPPLDDNETKDAKSLPTASNKLTDFGAYEDWFGSEIMVPRGDRILEQFVVMLLRIAAYLKNDGTDSIHSRMFNSGRTATWPTRDNMEAMSTDVTDTPPLVGNTKGQTASYLRNYPKIFMKKNNTESPETDSNINVTENTGNMPLKSHSNTLSNKSNRSHKFNDTKSLESKRTLSDTIINLSSKNSSSDELRFFIDEDKPKLNDNASVKSQLPKQERSSHSNTEALPKNAEVEVKRIIEDSLEKVLLQSLNYSNAIHEEVEVKPEIVPKPTSDNNIAPDEFVLPLIEEMVQCCSKSIKTPSSTTCQSILGHGKPDGQSKESENVQPETLFLAENKDAIANNDVENNEVMDTNNTRTSGLENTNDLATTTFKPPNNNT